MTPEETVEIRLKLPKKLVDFMKSTEGENVEEYLAYNIIELYLSVVEFEADKKGIESEELMDKFDLKPVFKQHGVLPIYYKA